MKHNLKEFLQEQFNQVFGDKYRLLAVHLDGFSHAVIYDEGTKESPIHRKHSSAYTIIDEQAFEMLGQISHHSYQGNAQEIIYLTPLQRWDISKEGLPFPPLSPLGVDIWKAMWYSIYIGGVMNKNILAVQLVEYLYEVYGLNEIVTILRGLEYSDQDIYDLFMDEFSMELVDFLEEQAWIKQYF